MRSCLVSTRAVTSFTLTLPSTWLVHASHVFTAVVQKVGGAFVQVLTNAIIVGMALFIAHTGARTADMIDSTYHTMTWVYGGALKTPFGVDAFLAR